MHGKIYDLFLSPLDLFSLRELRHEVLAHATGKTLELGIGTGLNLPHYPYYIRLKGIEPDEGMRRRAIHRASNATHLESIELVDGDAEKLAFPDGEFDTVVATLVFCTIPHPETALREAHRVLKPGGLFLLLEHVRSDTAIVGHALDLLTPVWKLIAGGCHLNRDPGSALVRLGFKIETQRQFWHGLGKLWVLRK